ncbi:hypothetical protein ACCO45_009646 [Purpureocillium lilacinum]|uniref:Uncharacterized protein n=1 Tax=Purpureocillium lilacinum TaxID=33203 RepID=A0ACC4DKD9_PURLI
MHSRTRERLNADRARQKHPVSQMPFGCPVLRHAICVLRPNCVTPLFRVPRRQMHIASENDYRALFPSQTRTQPLAASVAVARFNNVAAFFYSHLRTSLCRVVAAALCPSHSGGASFRASRRPDSRRRVAPDLVATTQDHLEPIPGQLARIPRLAARPQEAAAMAVASIQDRTAEFKSVLAQAQRRQNASKVSSQRKSLLSDSQKAAANGDATPRRSDFARKAAEIGRSISATMGKLEKLAQLAKRRTLFDDRPVEINELTFVIKQDLSSLNQQIGALQTLSKQQHPKADQEGEHNKNVVYLLQGKLTDVSVNFKDVLEERTRNIQASRSRTENFISSVSQHAQPSMQQSASPLYGTPNRASPAPGSGSDTLSLNPVGDQQLMMMEEAQPTNTYIQQRGEAIESIEKTISELGSIFGQLATMVSEQSEMIQRIDANTEDVVDNVEGAQRSCSSTGHACPATGGSLPRCLAC